MLPGNRWRQLEPELSERVTITEPPTSPFSSDATTPPPLKAPLTTAELMQSVGVLVHFCGCRGLRGAVMLWKRAHCSVSSLLALALLPLSSGPLSTSPLGLAFYLLGLKGLLPHFLFFFIIFLWSQKVRPFLIYKLHIQPGNWDKDR